MADPEARLIRQFGRTFRLLESWIEADILEELRETIISTYGATPEHRLLKVLMESEGSLPLCEVAARCGQSRRAVLQGGRLRVSLERLGARGMVLNTGTPERPRYRLNLELRKVRLLSNLLNSGDAIDATKRIPRLQTPDLGS